MILDVIACGLVIIFEVFAVFISAILIQGIIYRTTGFSIWNCAKMSIEKEITPAKVISLKNNEYM